MTQFEVLYDRLLGFVPILGREGIDPSICLPHESNGEHPSDVTLATLTRVKQEIARCEAEIVSGVDALSDRAAVDVAISVESNCCFDFSFARSSSSMVRVGHNTSCNHDRSKYFLNR